MDPVVELAEMQRLNRSLEQKLMLMRKQFQAYRLLQNQRFNYTMQKINYMRCSVNNELSARIVSVEKKNTSYIL